MYVAGRFTSLNGETRNRLGAVSLAGDLLAWNPESSHLVVAMAVTDRAVYVGGYFDTIAGVEKSNLAAITHAGATVMDFPDVNSIVRDLDFDFLNDTLFVAGSFTEVNGEERRGVASISADGELLDWETDMVSASLTMVDATSDAIYLGGNYISVNFRRGKYQVWQR